MELTQIIPIDQSHNIIVVFVGSAMVPIRNIFEEIHVHKSDIK